MELYKIVLITYDKNVLIFGGCWVRIASSPQITMKNLQDLLRIKRFFIDKLLPNRKNVLCLFMVYNV